MENFNFEAYQRDVEKKAAASKAAIEGLYDGSGQPVFMPDFHKEHMQRALAPLEQSVAEAIELAQRAEVEAKKLEALQHADPLGALSTADLQRLDVARELAQQDIESLTPPELAARLLTVANSGDKVSQMLHLIFAKPIVSASQDTDLRSRFEEIDQIVNGKERAKAAKAMEQAEALRQQAAELNFYARHSLAEIDGSNADSLARRKLEYSGYI